MVSLDIFKVRRRSVAIGTAGLALAFTLTGCMGSQTLRPLPPVPTTSVSSSSLPEPITIAQDPTLETQTLDGAVIDPNAPLAEPVGAASLDAASLPAVQTTGAAVSEDDLIGAWTATTPAASCSLNLSLTSWEGGFRGSALNCADVQVAGLTAWAIEEQQVLLKSEGGVVLARLFRTGATRYAGQLETGEAITLFR